MDSSFIPNEEYKKAVVTYLHEINNGLNKNLKTFEKMVTETRRLLREFKKIHNLEGKTSG